MEQKKFTRTSFYAENLGEGNFAAALPVHRWECSRCGKVKNFSTMPPPNGCIKGGMHMWRRTS